MAERLKSIAEKLTPARDCAYKRPPLTGVFLLFISFNSEKPIVIEPAKEEARGNR
jgi:hypothetical protein